MSVISGFKPDTRNEWIAAGVGGAVGARAADQVVLPRLGEAAAMKSTTAYTNGLKDLTRSILKQRMSPNDVLAKGTHIYELQINRLTDITTVTKPSGVKRGVAALLGAAIGFGLVAGTKNLFD